MTHALVDRPAEMKGGRTMTYVVELKELDRHAIGLVGGKNANLGELLNRGIRVPPGFAVTVDGFSHYLREAGIRDDLFRLLGEVQTEDTTCLDTVSAEIRALFRQSQMPGAIMAELQSHYEQLEEACGRGGVPVAVRSSATAEDLPNASFAGQQDTYLWVRGVEEIAAHVRRCWASLYSSRAISYRVMNGFPHEKVLMSVCVQKMVNSKAAGVMFTLDPANGDVSQVLVEGNWGLGESVASGEVTPDQFKVNKITKEIGHRHISHKHLECIPDPDGGIAKMVPIEDGRSDKSCVTDEELREIVRISRLIEDHYAGPQDIEWAIDHDLAFPENVFIVQTRPETVWSQKEPVSLLAGKSAGELLLQRALQVIKVG
jgi:pyruvate,water dikinase